MIFFPFFSRGFSKEKKKKAPADIKCSFSEVGHHREFPKKKEKNINNNFLGAHGPCVCDRLGNKEKGPEGEKMRMQPKLDREKSKPFLWESSGTAQAKFRKRKKIK